MEDELERRWDDAVERAWAQFRARLADAMAARADDDPLLVVLPGPEDELVGSTPYCQVMPYGDRLRVEAVSNAFLDAAHVLDERQEEHLCRLGFEPPDGEETPNFWLDLERRQADRGACAVVDAMRWVHGVLHPVYLDAEGLEPQPVGEVVPAPADEGRASLPDLDGDGPWTPRSGDEVRAMLLRAAAGLVEGEPDLDGDGDLSITVGDCLLWVTVGASIPRVLMSAVLAVDVVDEVRAAAECNLLNRREFGLTFLTHDGRVVVRRELPVSVFVLDDVRREMERILDDLERWSEDLLARVGGRAPYADGPAQLPADQRRPADAAAPAQPAPVQERLAAATAVLRELEKDDPDGLRPALLLDVFDGDRALIVGAIRETREQEARADRRAHRSEKNGRPRLERAFRARARHERDLRRRLRRALRLAVERTARDRGEQQLSLFGEDEVSR